MRMQTDVCSIRVILEMSKETTLLGTSVTNSMQRNSRRNGYSWPTNALQLLSWCTFVYLTLFTLLVLIRSFQSTTISILLYTILSLIILLTACCTIIVTWIDPADSAVRDRLQSRIQPDYDRDKHLHVINDDHYCNICEHIVDTTSKHCRQCNKCVEHFDHHCKWLNNCIGRHNYRYFIMHVTSVCLSTGIITALIIFVLIDYTFNSGRSLNLDSQSNLRIMFDPNASMVAWLWLVICAGTLVLTLIVSILTFNLLMFHIKLLKRGMTTYNFIMGERAVVAATNAVDKQCCWRRKNHRRVQSIQSTTITTSTSVQPPANMFSDGSTMMMKTMCHQKQPPPPSMPISHQLSTNTTTIIRPSSPVVILSADRLNEDNRSIIPDGHYRNSSSLPSIRTRTSSSVMTVDTIA